MFFKMNSTQSLQGPKEALVRQIQLHGKDLRADDVQAGFTPAILKFQYQVFDSKQVVCKQNQNMFASKHLDFLPNCTDIKANQIAHFPSLRDIQHGRKALLVNSHQLEGKDRLETGGKLAHALPLDYSDPSACGQSIHVAPCGFSAKPREQNCQFPSSVLQCPQPVCWCIPTCTLRWYSAYK